MKLEKEIKRRIGELDKERVELWERLGKEDNYFKTADIVKRIKEIDLINSELRKL
jgi:hypothetical protein